MGCEERNVRGWRSINRKERWTRSAEEECSGGLCYPEDGGGSRRLEARALLSQFHAGRSAAQTSSKVVSGISRLGVFSWVPHLFWVDRNPVPTSASQVNAAQSLGPWRVPHQKEKFK